MKDNQPQVLVSDQQLSDLHTRLATLAASYTPEWRFTPQSPDIGTTIALIFANQMQENVRKLNLLPQKYHTELINMLGISLLPAYPSRGIVTAEIISETVAGVELSRGSRVVGRDADNEPIVFETAQDLYLTSAKLTDMLSISQHFGKIIPLLGSLQAIDLETLRTVRNEDIEPVTVLSATPLFDYSIEGVEHNALLLYHNYIFDTLPGMPISLKITEERSGRELASVLADPMCYRWCYVTPEGTRPFASVTVQDDTLLLVKAKEDPEAPAPVEGAKIINDMIRVEALQPVGEPMLVSSLQMASGCEPVSPDFVCHNEQELVGDAFMPLGTTASLFDECYIGHHQIFSQQGSVINISFELSSSDKLVTFTPEQEKGELKIIKKKPRAVQFDTVNTAPQEISLEYFNGVGWRNLPGSSKWSTLFDGTHCGHITITFVCPEDWKPSQVGGYVKRCLRLRLLRADNCYLQPCIHTMPVLRELQIDYSYADNWKSPQRLQAVCGTTVIDCTARLHKGIPIPAFSPLPYSGNAVYLGFDRKIESGPVSLLLHIKEATHFESVPVTYQYFASSGWKQLKVIDGTDGLSGVGTVRFMPPTDFIPCKVEGISRYWIRMIDETAAFNNPQRYHPVLTGIDVNAVEIHNVETLPEENFYIENTTPNMTFPLSAQNILRADVFVNEKNRFTAAEMQELVLKEPDRVRVEYNFLGEISQFYVRWDEVDSFDRSQPDSRHYVLDRLENKICFGDGVGVQIPAANTGVAFKLQLYCCQGARGNLPVNAVNALVGRSLYIDKLQNPLATCEGSNLESLARIHRRGANLINGHNRLVSQLDYLRETNAFADNIAKVRCITGYNPEGQQVAGMIAIAVMTTDYMDGAYSFSALRDRLTEHLLSRSEATVCTENLLVTEPVYVSISVDVWVEVNDLARAFDVQNLIRDRISEFLNPLGSSEWEIGIMPSESQLAMLLQSFPYDGRIIHWITTARYIDRTGVHEVSLDALPENPFMIGVDGTHRIYVELPQ
ncbi:MAG: hypothetical protein RR654_02365 [Oscillospiraceae bacterium]